MDERQKNPLSIVDRIKNAGDHLGVSRGEIEQELSSLFESNNSVGTLELFNAYRSWEAKQNPDSPVTRSPEEISELAMSNFDLVARIADRRKVGKDDYSTLSLAHSDKKTIGPIQRFYRDTVGYYPEPPDNSHLN